MRNNTVNWSNPHSRAQRMHTSGAPMHQLLLSLDRSLMPRPAGTNSAAKTRAFAVAIHRSRIWSVPVRVPLADAQHSADDFEK